MFPTRSPYNCLSSAGFQPAGDTGAQGVLSGQDACVATASIIVLTHNGEKYLSQILEMIQRQKAKPREIIAIDSGSSDGTLEILRKPSVELHCIPEAEFSHSKTRNLGARLAQGKYVVFLTQDATPADSCWLDRLLYPFEAYSNVAGTFSRQIPRPGSDLLEANDLHVYFQTVRQVKNFPQDADYFRRNVWSYIQFSNVSGAYDRELLLQNPFNEKLPMAEDQEWAKRMLEKGFTIVYEPESMVLHSHNFNLGQKKRRHFDFGVSFSQFLSPELGRRPFPWKQWLYQMMMDSVYIADSDAAFGTKLKWLCLSPIHRAAMHYAYYKGWNSVAHKA